MVSLVSRYIMPLKPYIVKIQWPESTLRISWGCSGKSGSYTITERLVHVSFFYRRALSTTCMREADRARPYVVRSLFLLSLAGERYDVT